MERTAENIITSFFFYMWNMWSKEECVKIFGKIMGKHFYDKWERICELNQGPWGAAECLYKEMSSEYRELLVSRALECYNGMCKIKGNGTKK